ncbi:tetratricopeptide repeat protein [Kitasatospora sp. NPDC001540]|uniref:tetratricopeptide repeat protein n=1 Tax=Kitasatospora sp. NPDC001540 TaxID=3364014 RepID=UPI0036B8D62D
MIEGRYVGIGVGDYTGGAHRNLAHAADDAVALREVLGDSLVGEPLVNPDESELRAFLKSLKRSMPEGGPLIVLWSGHGFLAPGGLRLPATDSGADPDDGFAVADVVTPCALSGANQLLFVFDTCFAGEAVASGDLATQILRETEPAKDVWVGVIGSCLSVETARDGLFGQRLRKIVGHGPDTPELRVRWSPHNRYVRGDDLCDALLKEWGSSVQSPDYQSRGNAWWMIPNPLYRPGAPERVVEHLLRAARGGAPLDERSWFTGRTREVDQVVAWVHRRSPGLHVVTGSAGTGKSAIVGRVVSLANPEERRRLLAEGRAREHALPEERSVHAHVHARGLTADLAAHLLGEQLVQRRVLRPQEMRRNASELVGQVQRAVEDGAPPPVVVVDGLDEARGEAFSIAEDLLTRLAKHAVVIVSTRERRRDDGQPSLVETLAPEGADVDLDDPAVQQRGRSDLADYVRLRLGGVDPRMNAEAVAAHVSGQASDSTRHPFLLARLIADQLSAAPVDTSVPGWENLVSRSIEGALDTDLNDIAPAPHRQGARQPAPAELARAVLQALTWSYGAGLPEGEWLCVANAAPPEGIEITREDITWVLEQLGRHVVQDGEAGAAVYRMAHQSLADHLRPPHRGSPEQPFDPTAPAVARALTDRYRALLDGGIPAEEAGYLWRYAWRHAADAGLPGLELLGSLAGSASALRPDVAMASLLIANQFSHWGLRVEAVPLTEEAVRLYRELAEQNPALLPDLAGSLTYLGVRYGEVGLRVEAVPFAEEAVRLYRELVEQNPAYVPSLAGSLTHLGVRYGEVGRRVEAVPFAEEAVRLYRELVEQSPAYVPNLAGSLTNLGACYGEVGWWAEAVPLAEESVRLRRELAERNPAFLPDLASALNNLGVRYGEVGRRAEAVPPIEEAVRLRRELAERNPAFLPELASALNNLGACYSVVGRWAEAMPSAEEATRLYRELAERNPAYVPSLAGSLTNLGACYGEVGWWAEAVPPAEEATRLYRELAERNPAYVPSLAGSLTNLGACYGEVGRWAEAVSLAEESVRLRRELAERNPAFLPDLAGSLNNLGVRYGEVGRWAEAVPLTEEAVRLYRELAERNPAFLPDLAGSLNNLGVRYGEVGRRAEAVPLTEEAVRLYRELAEQNPTLLPDLAGSLNNLGLRYGVVGRWAEAVPSAEEAVRLYRELAEQNPTLLPDLAGSLTNLGACYGEVGRKVEPVWEEVLRGLDPRAVAYLLLARASAAEPGDADAATWLATASAAAPDDPALTAALREAGRRHRAAAPGGFDEAWSRRTGAEPPGWLFLDVALLESAQAWVSTETYEAERDHLAAHPELLGPDADVAVDEALLAVGDEEGERYRQLREAAKEEGVARAYRPLLLSVLALEFADSDPAAQRRLLGERGEDLADDTVLATLAQLAVDAAPEPAPGPVRARSLIELAGLGEHEAALAALEDPSHFPELLQALARRPAVRALEPAARLALTAATDPDAEATATFYLAVAAAARGEREEAGRLLGSAHRLRPDAAAGWIAELVDIAGRHPAVLPLITQLAGKPRTDASEAPDAHH